MARVRPLALVLPLALAACQTAPLGQGSLTPGGPTAGGLKPWEKYERMPLGAKASGLAGRVGPVVPVQVDMGPLLAQLRQQRRLLGLGFGWSDLGRVVLKVIGPGIPAEDLIEVVVDEPSSQGAAIHPAAGPVSLGVPAGPNRVFSLEARELAQPELVQARLRSLASVPEQMATMALSFDAKHDAAARVLEDLLTRFSPEVAASSPVIQSLASTDATAELLSYVQAFTGYQAETNAYTGVNPLYFKDWILATALVEDGDLDRLYELENVGATGEVGDMASELRTRLHVVLDGEQATQSGSGLTLYDPIRRGHEEFTTFSLAQGEQATLAAVPPGTWAMRVRVNGQEMTAQVEVPDPEGETELDLHVPFQAGGQLVTCPTTLHEAPGPIAGMQVGEVRTLSGSAVTGGVNGRPGKATWQDPTALALLDRRLFVAEPSQNRVREVHLDTGVAQDVVTYGLDHPNALAAQGNRLLISDSGQGQVRTWDLANHHLSPALGNLTHPTPHAFQALAFGHLGNLVVGLGRGVDILVFRDGAGEGVDFRFFTDPTALAADASGWYASSGAVHGIYRNDPHNNLALLAGSLGAGRQDGVATDAFFNQPGGIAIEPGGTTIYVADTGNHSIRKLVRQADDRYLVTTIAGSMEGSAGFADGVATAARFAMPRHLAYDTLGYLYIADSGNHRIRRMRVH